MKFNEIKKLVGDISTKKLKKIIKKISPKEFSKEIKKNGSIINIIKRKLNNN